MPKHDKTSVFAAERMEPMTEAEYQAEKAGQDAPQASETPAPRKVRIDLTPSVHARLQEYQRAMSFTRRSNDKARPWVTLNETMEYLLDLADAQAQLLAEVLDGK